jgi:hypothetical protein
MVHLPGKETAEKGPFWAGSTMPRLSKGHPYGRARRKMALFQLSRKPAGVAITGFYSRFVIVPHDIPGPESP